MLLSATAGTSYQSRPSVQNHENHDFRDFFENFEKNAFFPLRGPPRAGGGGVFFEKNQKNQKNRDFSDFGDQYPEGLTARGGLDGPHLGHPLRRDQVRGSAYASNLQ